MSGAPPREPPPRYTRAQLQTIIGDLVNHLDPVLPPGLAFALFLFDFGDRGSMAFASNAYRRDMVRALREMLDRLELA